MPSSDETQRSRIKLDRSDLILKITSYTVVSLFALFCLIPFVMMLSASLSSEDEIRRTGFGLLPRISASTPISSSSTRRDR